MEAVAARKYTGPFTQQEPIPDAAVAALQSGRLHRYNLIGEEAGEVAP